jgi:N-dimethylarginine dimethylaminohydrolase
MMIVHDPTAFAAFRYFPAVNHDGELLRTFLYREPPDVGRLADQHRQFVQALRSRVEVVYLSDILGTSHLSLYRKDFDRNPNQLYAHDAMITIPWVPGGCIFGRMKEEIRRREPLVMTKVAELLALNEIVGIPSHLYLEGGDVIPFCHGGTRALLIGYGPRTSKETLLFLRETLIRDGVIDEIIGFELAPWRLNIDGCFFPLAADVAVSHRESIIGGMRLDREGVERLHPLQFFRSLGFHVIETTREESYFQQACNFACLGQGVFAAYRMTDRINDLLRGAGLDIIGMDGDELVKGNGGPHCMTRPVYRSMPA